MRVDVRRLQGVSIDRVQESRHDVVEEGRKAGLLMAPHSCMVSAERSLPHVRSRGVILLTRQNLPDSKVAQRVLLILVLPRPGRGGESSDLGLDLLARSLGVVGVEDGWPVRLKNRCPG